MGTMYLHAVASLDGYIADERDDVGPLHDWYFKGDHPLVDEDHADVHGAPFRVSAAWADYVRGMWSRQKVLVIGRHQFDLTMLLAARRGQDFRRRPVHFLARCSSYLRLCR
jgi:hypothetical protein